MNLTPTGKLKKLFLRSLVPEVERCLIPSTSLKKEVPETNPARAKAEVWIQTVKRASKLATEMTEESRQRGRSIRVKAGQKPLKRIIGLVLLPVKIDQVGRQLRSTESRELPPEEMLLKAMKGPPMQKKMVTLGLEIKVQER
jgi:hypothetical protein